MISINQFKSNGLKEQFMSNGRKVGGLKTFKICYEKFGYVNWKATTDNS